MTQPIPPFIDPNAPQHVPLAYMIPPQNPRPGMITAIGVISIVIASLSTLSALGSSFQAIAMFFMSNTNRTPAATTAPAGLGTLSATEVTRAIAAIRSSGVTLTPQQLATLQTELQSPTQAFIAPGTPSTSGIVASAAGNGSV